MRPHIKFEQGAWWYVFKHTWYSFKSIRAMQAFFDKGVTK